MKRWVCVLSHVYSIKDISISYIIVTRDPPITLVSLGATVSIGACSLLQFAARLFGRARRAFFLVLAALALLNNLDGVLRDARGTEVPSVHVAWECAFVACLDGRVVQFFFDVVDGGRA